MVDEVLGVGRKPEPVDPKRPEKSEDKKGSKGREVSSKLTESQGDSLSISSEAKSALDKTRLVDMVNSIPEIREDKVEEARQMVDSGDVFSPEVTEKLAEELEKLL
jgi:anti-sigma28 factor (negative regulator of flagellin synthesis)